MLDSRTRRRVVIMGAAGRDFHDFNVVFRDDPGSEVVAFTATQIPGIAGRRYPPELAGPAYPAGIPIVPEAELEATIEAHGVRRVVFGAAECTREAKGEANSAAGAPVMKHTPLCCGCSECCPESCSCWSRSCSLWRSSMRSPPARSCSSGSCLLA